MEYPEFYELAQECFRHCKDSIKDYWSEKGIQQDEYVSEAASQSPILKGETKLDRRLHNEITNIIHGDYAIPMNIFGEDRHEAHLHAQGSLFFDIIDGGRNHEKRVGNPSFVCAYSHKTGTQITLDDIDYAFCAGYRTPDIYHAGRGLGAIFEDRQQESIEDCCAQGPTQLSEAIAYIKFGYTLAKDTLVNSLPLVLAVKDIRGFDNTATEICEIARGAAHILDEPRKSDMSNLLVYRILKEAGGVIVDEHGHDIGSYSVFQKERSAFIAAVNQELVDQALTLQTQFKNSQEQQSLSVLLKKLNK